MPLTYHLFRSPLIHPERMKWIECKGSVTHVVKPRENDHPAPPTGSSTLVFFSSHTAPLADLSSSLTLMGRHCCSVSASKVSIQQVKGKLVEKQSRWETLQNSAAHVSSDVFFICHIIFKFVELSVAIICFPCTSHMYYAFLPYERTCFFIFYRYWISNSRPFSSLISTAQLTALKACFIRSRFELKPCFKTWCAT